MTPLLSIGEMAKKSQLSIQRLRYYDKIGLLVPAFTDPTSGYRYYEVAQEEQLNFIQALQYMGFSLKAIKQYLDKNTPEAYPNYLLNINKSSKKMKPVLPVKNGYLIGSNHFYIANLKNHNP